MITVDGSHGEGGGQVLRSSLTLSILTRRDFRITNIRSNRPNPGLQAQHLKAIDAAAAISKAQVEGGFMRSTNITFRPGNIRTGRYKFDIKTAGSTSLVLQTILVPLCQGQSASTVTITGGTHVPWSPCFHYLDLHWLHYLRNCGYNVTLNIDKAGFYPIGGGRINATIRPISRVTPLKLSERKKIRRIYGISGVANLDISIAVRQKRQALHRLSVLCHNIKIKNETLRSPGKGTFIIIIGEFDPLPGVGYAQCCYFALGARGRPAEDIADEATDKFERFLDSNANLDEYLADQLLLPLAFASGVSEFRTPLITKHLISNAEIIQMFTKTRIHITGDLNQPGLVKIIPQSVQ
jgi:RNA 3'-phosphate cyclase